MDGAIVDVWPSDFPGLKGRKNLSVFLLSDDLVALILNCYGVEIILKLVDWNCFSCCFC
jgi:hypothetical protein